MNMMSTLVLFIATMLCARTMAQSDCTNVLIGMAPCLSYVSGSSSTPSAQCCSQLASVVRSNPRCLCMVLGDGGSSLGVSINQTLALALPGACNVQTPPVSRCNAGPPEALPSDDSAGTGSKAVPSTGGSGASNALSVNAPFQLILSVVFMASYALIASSL
ncbi:non-specific lipid transfer protein GPI-anchored 5-like [Citrus sinensis]|uniref:non-specific lipid transfer protein GPI-anchored 5-like n=1 Tax=Citrus sinensis TaxID=2711 RepID=UPI00227835A9|nr:non-specific lipid transfer protein GPI-anchored 5-like [Citrus sinensis]